MKASEALATYDKAKSRGGAASSSKSKVPAGAIIASEHTAKDIGYLIATQFASGATRVTIVKRIGIANYQFHISRTGDGAYALRRGEDIIADGTHNLKTIFTAMLNEWGVH